MTNAGQLQYGQALWGLIFRLRSYIFLFGKYNLRSCTNVAEVFAKAFPVLAL